MSTKTKSKDVVVSAAPVSDVVESSASDVVDAVVKDGLKSFHLMATIYTKDGARLVQFQPSGRGDDALSAMIKVVAQFPNSHAVAVEVNRIDLQLADGLKARIAWRRSSQQCETCGSNHTTPRKDCDDPKGCLLFLNAPKTVQKHGKLDEVSHLAKLAAALNVTK